MDCINKRSYIQLDVLKKKDFYRFKLISLIYLAPIQIYKAHSFPFYMTSQFHLFGRINICRKKVPEYKRGKVKDEDLPRYENALCGSAPMFEVDDQMISPWHRWSGRFLFPSGVCHERWTAAPRGPMKRIVIRGTSCKKLLTNIRLIKHTSVCEGVCVRGIKAWHYPASWVNPETNAWLET